MGNNRFSDGFLIGALVGGIAVYLFATKKGNKILHAVSEQGMSGLTDLIEDLEQRREGLEPQPEEVPKSNGSTPKKRFFKRSK